MTEYYHSQDVFSKGELAPTMYSRISTVIYGKGLKTAKNVLPIPQGGAKKRFGTEFRALLTQTNYKSIKPVAFDYLDQCIYQLIFYNDNIAIYLEGRLVATQASTNILLADIDRIDETVLGASLRVSIGTQAARDLIRSASAANTITAVDTTTYFITLNTAITNDIILPVTFVTTGSYPTSVPQIIAGRVYFIRALSTTTASVYTNPVDARKDTNRMTFSAAGSGNTMIAQNTWAFAAITFKNNPTYDFDGGYNAITFTPAATIGVTTLLASSAIFTAGMVGGLYFANGGVARITAFTDTTNVDILVIDDFASAAAQLGRLVVLTEPAWSAARGFPRVCSSYENRAFFGNSELLRNGIWGSSINDYDDFDDSSVDSDQGISYFPSADTGNGIKFFTPYRTFIVTTESGSYSTSSDEEKGITPVGFSLTLQDNTPSSNIQPVIIDNQLIVLAGRDVNALVWDSSRAKYTPGLISAASEHLITDPISMSVFRDNDSIGGRYLFITNTDAPMAMYQSLMSEEIGGWTSAETEQSYGDSYFRHTISSVSGRCWFVVEREIATGQTPVTITGFDADAATLTANATNFSLTVPTACLFAIGTSLPVTSPQIKVLTYYFAVGIDANDFKIYSSKAAALAGLVQTDDAQTDTNTISIISAGVTATVAPFTIAVNLVLEELSNDVKTDCTILQSGTDLTTATGLTLFNAQEVTVKADGIQYDLNPVLSDVVNVTALGTAAEVQSIETGFPIEYKVEPLPLSISTGNSIQTSNLARAKHVRTISLMFADTVGGKVNNQNITLTRLNNQSFVAPTGNVGLMEVSTMSGWNMFESPPITITQNQPFDFNLLGLFYNTEV